MTASAPALARTLLAGAALSLAVAGGSQPADARGGDITRGVLMGLAAGVIIDQMARSNAGYGYAYRDYGYPAPGYYYSPQHRYYYPQRQRVYTRTYYYTPGYTYYAPRQAYRPPAHVSPLARAFRSQDRRLRISIQYRLMESGYYNAALDGLWGPATQGALYNYARDNGELAMLTNQQDANQLFADILR
jgi:hypothetical protein